MIFQIRLQVICSLVIFLLLLSTPISTSADFPVEGNYLGLDSGTSEPFSQFDDQVVLVEAFATWCEPCKSEMHELSRLHNAYKDDLILFSLSISPGTDNLDKIQSFKQTAEEEFDFTADWEFGLDTQDSSNTKSFAYIMEISVIPTSILIDETGDIVNKWEGVVEAEEISSYIDANVTFPENSQSHQLLDQLLGNTLFRLFMVSIVMLVLYRLVVPPSKE